MRKGTGISSERLVEFKKFKNELAELLRKGALQLLLQGVETELEVFLENYKQLYDIQDRRAVVKNGYLLTQKTPNSIGSIFATVKRRMTKTEGSTIAVRGWTECPEGMAEDTEGTVYLLSEVVWGVKFIDGIAEDRVSL